MVSRKRVALVVVGFALIVSVMPILPVHAFTVGLYRGYGMVHYINAVDPIDRHWYIVSSDGTYLSCWNLASNFSTFMVDRLKVRFTGNITDSEPTLGGSAAYLIDSIVVLGDVKGDNAVDIFDAIVFAGCYNTTAGSPRWNQAADLNFDGIVDVFDALLLAGNYGTHMA